MKVKKLKAHRGEVSQLSLADSFMYRLIQVPRWALNFYLVIQIYAAFNFHCKFQKLELNLYDLFF